MLGCIYGIGERNGWWPKLEINKGLGYIYYTY